MPRLKLNLPRSQAHWTKVPNYLIQSLLPTLTDTELRVLLVLLRQTAGWNKPDATVVIPYRKLMKWTGRSSETVWKAVQSLSLRRLVHSESRRSPRKMKHGVSEFEQQQTIDSN